MDHDITLTPENEEHDCCTDDTENCFPMTISSLDSFYKTVSVECLEFTRSVEYCEENSVAGEPRQQINGITSFIDSSNVYGSDDDTASQLRSFTGTFIENFSALDLALSPLALLP